MAGSPYATLAGVLQADVTTLRDAFFYHTSRHQCRVGECEAREVLEAVRDKMSEMLEREKASSSPAPQRSVTFTPQWPELKVKPAQSGGSGVPPELESKLAQSDGTGSRSRWPFMRGRLLRSGATGRRQEPQTRGPAEPGIR